MIFHLEILAENTGLPICYILEQIIIYSNKYGISSDNLVECVYASVLHGNAFIFSLEYCIDKVSKGYNKDMILESLY